MLSKSAARAFFLLGTALCGIAFIGLTLDTFQRIPEQTHSEQLTAPVAHGKRLWEANNCMGCHSILGEGAYYAPELTKVIERRGSGFVRAMLRDPEAMYPEERKMVKYDFSDEEIEALVEFFAWIGQMDLNGFPPEPSLAGGGVTASPAAKQRPATFNQTCVACHSVDGRGGQVGPSLDGVGSRLDRDYLRRWLSDPQSVKPGTAMPNLGLAKEQLDELGDYLATLKEN